MKKLTGFFLIVVVFMLSGRMAFADTTTKANIDKAAAASGDLRIGYTSDAHKQLKLMVVKGDNKYIYSMRNDGVVESYPLQMGNGEYLIYIYQNLQGTSYIPVYYCKINLNVKDTKTIYLYSIQNINWNARMKAVSKAKELTAGISGDRDKINAIYNYVISNIHYDFDKLKNLNKLPNPYIPVIDDTLSDQKGICYDFASLFAAMLRSINIPTKLIMGYSKNVTEYHAWNEVYLKDENSWATVDTTFDSQMKTANRKFTLVKDDNLYSTSKMY